MKKTVLFGLLLSVSCLLPGQTEKITEIAPGIVLPSSGTVYGLDNLNDKKALIQIHAAEVAWNTHAGSNFARSAVYAGPRSTVELKGISAAATFHTPQVVLYVRLSTDDPELLRNRVTLIRLKTDKDRRIVSGYSQNIFGGQRKRQYDEVAVEKSDVAGTQWLKLVPQATLDPGEYGAVFLPKDVNLFADAVYDFNIGGDPKGTK